MSTVRRAGTGAHRDLCVMVAIDVANAFNSAPWTKIGEALRCKGVPASLLKTIKDYPSNRRIITDNGEVHYTIKTIVTSYILIL